MTLTKPMSDARNIAANTPVGRDRAVDVARLAALVVVMFGHCALLLATIDTRGLRIGNLLGELPAIAPITWVVQVMPLFFFAGGAAGAYGWHAGTPWGTWLFTRAQRLCRPVFWYLAAWSVVLLVARMVLGEESAAGLGRECVALLWFLGVYLVVLAFVPALTRLGTGRAVAVVVASLLATAAAVDGVRIAVDMPMSGAANFLIVWLIPVAIGVAYARRLIGPRAACAVAASALRRADCARHGRAVRRLAGRHRNRAHVQRVTLDPVARAALHLDVVHVRGRRGRDPPVGRASPCLVRRRGRQRGSDDALPLAPSLRSRLPPSRCTSLVSTRTTLTRRGSGLSLRCGRLCSRS
jgi:hypothetical protein